MCARSDTNARVFGYPGTRPGSRAAFPKVRLVLLIEAGTHLIFDALVCPYRMGERVRALKLLRTVTSGMLLMWDRGQYGSVKGFLRSWQDAGDKGLGGQGEKTIGFINFVLSPCPLVTLSPCPFLTRELLNRTVLGQRSTFLCNGTSNTCTRM